MLQILRIYFGFAEDPRTAEGFLSWQHLLFATVVCTLSVLLAVFLGKKYKNDSLRKNRVLKIAALAILFFELFKIVLISVRSKDIGEIRNNFPLFLCSIMLFALPLSAFSKGRLRLAALDFSLTFGALCMLAGTFLAGNLFDSPIFRFDNNVSILTHCISGFSAIFIGVTGMATMKKKNIILSVAILFGFELLALGVDLLQLPTDYQSNYMFFTDPAGTPFSIFRSLAGGVDWIYTLLVFLGYFVYLFFFRAGANLVRYFRKK